MVHVGLDGVIQLQRTGDTIECFIRDINEDYTEALAIASDPRVCAQEEVELRMFLPTERSPIKCSGRISWHPDDEEQHEDDENYLVRILITHISRIDGRRLDLIISQKRVLARGV
jgi:hypothetical protein